MIAWLKGVVIEIDENEIIIDTNGVGYRVQVGNNLKLHTPYSQGDDIELAVYTAVKEDGIRLFGFQNFFTRKVFVLLLGVNGIGPKVALNIVDQLGAKEIIGALQQGNAVSFTKVSGVGKKTAQRIILDLQGKLDLLQLEGILTDGQTGTGRDSDLIGREEIFADAVSALSNLGFSAKQAENAIIKYLGPEMSLDDLIRKCLSDLRQKT